MVETFATGDLLRTCFHCQYSGYTGGLVIGNMNGSGMGFYPKQPLRGYNAINVFCAQDESIWDLDEKVEYTYGWSENLGTGPDGKRLEYVGGSILEHNDERVVLASENAGGCYRVFKVALTRAGSRYWIIATRIQNRCAKPVRFDLWTGDDPWIGRYASAEGDVGWTPRGLVRHESVLGLGRFTAGGFYDLGTVGETGSFSNQANFFALDPALALPDFAAFANRFAHTPRDVDEKRPLDHETMTALNLGWRGRVLAPGESLDMALALGLAQTQEPKRNEIALPRLPDIDDEAWSRWRQVMKTTSRSEEVLFASELVELHLDDGRLAVDALYHLHNPSAVPQVVSIDYPILVSTSSLAPGEVIVDGEPHPVTNAGPGQVAARFQLALPAHGLRSFRVHYQQRLLGPSASYLVTSARRWPQPLHRAVFVVDYPATWKGVRTSYPIRHRQTQRGRTTVTLVEQPFHPDREITVHWSRARP